MNPELLTVAQIEDKLLQGQVSPPELADIKMTLSVKASHLTGLLEPILLEKHVWLRDHREQYKSDAATRNAWQSTERGLEETAIRSKLKRIDLLLRGISSQLRVKEQEARNII